ncbi:MAG: hypothetical protein ACMUIU_02485 [bacterium]
MYLAKIEEYFFKYRRQGTILSPQNWLIAERWEQMGIPINIVCKGIKNTCRKFRSTHKEGEERIDMLTYCEPEILRLWKDYRKNLLGDPKAHKKGKTDSDFEQQSFSNIIQNRLEYIKDDLMNEVSESDPWGNLKAVALAGINWASEIENIEKEFCHEEHLDIELIEKRLSDLDDAYLNNLLRIIPNEQKSDLSKEIEEELSPYKKQMDKDAFEQTLELGIKGLLRERLNVRRISLYAS